MQFTYKTVNGMEILSIKTNQHVNVEVLFKGFSPTDVYLNDIEFDLNEDTAHGVFVAIGDKFISLIQLAIESSIEYEKIKEENRRAEKEAADMDKYLSSPQYTGRI